MKTNYETRAGLELRYEQRDGKPLIAGYAAVFDSPSVEFRTWDGTFVEKIQRGAFTNTLKKQPDIRALVAHDTSKVIGRTKNGTLILREDEKGLYSEIIPADTTEGRDILELTKRGDIDAMSFGFDIEGYYWKMENGKETRYITDVTLYEVSLVAFPAYPATSAATRSMPEAIKKELEQEKAKRSNQLKNASLRRRLTIYNASKNF